MPETHTDMLFTLLGRFLCMDQQQGGTTMKVTYCRCKGGRQQIGSCRKASTATY